ncbi:MAG: glutathione peroxidase [Flavobacteriales bacterium]|nr:glutathione peroxidase [Flavobacteriales bacterium]MDG1933784.1 glutathione peroxidase [Flavobacteriales bacterium]
MKHILVIIMILTSTLSQAKESFYDIKLNDINGKQIDLKSFEDKYILFVNVASKCGFTSQYTDLEKLHQQYQNDLVVIGLPCNQFGGQEPGNAEEIKNFCSSNYGVTFIISEKIEVKGEGMHPLYQWLTQKELNGKTSSTVKWNFQKYVVDKNGELLNYFYSMTGPLSNKITSLIE